MSGDKYYTFNNYMSENSLTATEEDYIEMIYRLCQGEEKSARVNDIAQKLHVKPPSVTKMIHKLKELHLVDYKKYGAVRLTEKGNEIGQFLIYRHNTVKSFLSLLHIDGDIHHETEKIEHTIDKNTLKGIEKLIRFFKANPEVFDDYISHET